MPQTKKIQYSFPFMFMKSIHEIYFLVQKHLEKELIRKSKISFSQFLILMFFSDCQDKKDNSQVSIAKYLLLTEATVSKHMTSLCKLKLVEKKQDKLNRRKQIIEITSTGAKIFYETFKIVDEELKKMFGKNKRNFQIDILKKLQQINNQILNTTKK